MKQIQSFQMEFKSVEVKKEDGSMFIEGFASTPEKDSYDDIVKPEAFSECMETYMKKPLILLQHNWDKIIGNVVEYRIEKKGLFVKARIMNDLDGTYNLIKEGLLNTFSIGFVPTAWNITDSIEKTSEETHSVREITKLDLWEISVVTFPANKGAIFSLAKSVKKFFNDLSGLKTLAPGAYCMKSHDIKEVELDVDNIKIVDEGESPAEETVVTESGGEKVAEVEIKEETNIVRSEVTPEVAPEEAPEVAPIIDSKEGAEKEGENPKAEELAPTTETSEVVKADEETEETPNGEETVEVETLIDTAINKAIGDMMEKLTERDEAILSLKKDIDSMKLEHKSFQDSLGAEVFPKGYTKKSTQVLTYQSLGIGKW